MFAVTKLGEASPPPPPHPSDDRHHLIFRGKTALTCSEYPLVLLIKDHDCVIVCAIF